MHRIFSISECYTLNSAWNVCFETKSFLCQNGNIHYSRNFHEIFCISATQECELVKTFDHQVIAVSVRGNLGVTAQQGRDVLLFQGIGRFCVILLNCNWCGEGLGGERTFTFPTLLKMCSTTRFLLPRNSESICISQPGQLLTPDDVGVHFDDKKNP